MANSGVESPQSALEEEEQATGSLVFLGDEISDLDHGRGGDDAVQVGAEMEERLDGRHLGDRVQVPAFIQDEIDMGEGLEATAEAALGAPHPLGDGAELAPVRAEQNDDAIGLAEGKGAKNDALIVMERHDRQGYRRTTT